MSGLRWGIRAAGGRDGPAESFYEAIIDASDDAIISKDLDGVVTSWNHAAEVIFGYTAAEMVGRPMVSIFPPERAAEEEAILASVARGETLRHFETERRRKDGTVVHISVTISPIRDGDGRVVGASKIARDITDRLVAERTIWRQANYDALTDLPNRRYFREQVEHALARARFTHRRVAVMFIDLDRFKEVNDSFGHAAGDDLLVQAAQRIKDSLREADMVARMGGDEFTILLPEVSRAEEVTMVARRVNQRLYDPFLIGEVPVQISGSIGIAVWPEDGQTVAELLTHADQAMYEAKRHGRNHHERFVQRAAAGAQSRLQLAADLRYAVERDELRLVYQPVVCLSTGVVHKCEALLRWQHPTRGLVSPTTFIPLAEETGLIREIGDWVFHTVAQQAAEWRARFVDGMMVGLNLSPAQLHGEMSYFERWIDALHALGLPGSSLVVEITEGMMVSQSDDTAAKLGALRQAGIQVAIDDFGTGYSNLSYLSRLDINYLKIDQSFTRALGSMSRDIALCEAIVVMAHKLGHKVVAEGVETQEQESLLRSIGCDYGQGFRFSRPVPAHEIEDPQRATPR